MSEYITKDQAVEFAVGANTYDGRQDVCVTIRAQDLHNAMNAAIQHYLDSLNAELPEPVGFIDAGTLESLVDPEWQQLRNAPANIWTINEPPSRAKIGLFTRTQLLAAIAKERAKRVPDMFWNADDSEKCHHSIGEFLNTEICNGNLEVGDTRTVQQAERLPDVAIRITAIDDEECEAEYEVIAAPSTQQEAS